MEAMAVAVMVKDEVKQGKKRGTCYYNPGISARLA